MQNQVHALVVIGTRPEALKLAPVVHEILRRREQFKLTVCATAQHRQLLDQVTSLFRIPVDYDLDIMSANQSLEELTARALTRFGDVLKQVKPDVVVVQGDTTTTFVASLGAFYQKMRVAHVEAGLRTNNRYSPFPEEINRRLTTQLTDFHFAPTAWARDNLLAEGIPAEKIYVTGNTVVDAFQAASAMVRRDPPAIPELDGADFASSRLLLVTAHRRENFGAGIQGICQALRQIAEEHEDVVIVYPVHPNPNVVEPVKRLLGDRERIHLIAPQEYLPFVWLMTKAYMVLTDSGGIQEEMPSLGRPVLVMRDTTERPEGVQAGVCRLVGTRTEDIVAATNELLNDSGSYADFARRPNPFGDGQAAKRIVDHLARVLGWNDTLGGDPGVKTGNSTAAVATS